MAKRALYRQVADQLRAAIEAGDYPPGAQLPGAEALSRQFGLSDVSVAKSLELLRRQRLVIIKRGVGTFVRGPEDKPILRDSGRRLSKEVWGNGRPIWGVDLGDLVPVPETEVTREEVVPEFVTSAIAAPRYLVRTRRYNVGGRPVQLATSYLDAELVAGTPIEHRNTGEGGTYARLAEIGHEPVFFRELYQSRLPDEGEAKRLKITEDEPVMEIVREAKTAEHLVVEVTWMLLVGDAYVVQATFTS